jgi:anhydro-N-acetylmuramic acid kinase
MRRGDDVIAVGLMSGTSLDGIDAVLLEIHPKDDTYALDVRRFVTQPFDDDLDAAVRSVLPPNPGTSATIARVHQMLGLAFGRAALAVAGGERVDYVASHGQTIFHDGEAHVTLQLGDAFVIREAMGATVCYDFRSADCAAQGHGAPLVPYVDALLFGSDAQDRVALNVGGIANVTLLLKNAPRGVAFDTGPGNMLVDALVAQRSAGQERFDRDGALASRGHVSDALLAAMLADPYFAHVPPKSTGRERFGAQFLLEHADALGALSLEDAAATLTEVTARSIADAVCTAHFESARILVSGGGASNATLMARLQARLPRARVERSDAMGVPADAKEAIAFAVLGYETLRGRAANVPQATGAHHAVVLGALAPHDLRALLSRIEDECRP